jgi:ABC-type transport system substrate-binding protein
VKEKFFSWLKKFGWPSNKEEVFFAFDSLSYRFKVIAGVFLIIFIVSTLLCLSKLNGKLMVEGPLAGGELNEGVLGTPRFINPLLAVSDADRDLTALVYSGLLRLSTAGSYEPDLAESYSVSSDGLT